MTNSYLLAALLLAGPAAAQTGPTDTLAQATPGNFRLHQPGDTLPVRALLNIQEQLSQVAGVQLTPFSGEPGTWNVVRIRGLTGLSDQGQPLVVVDGLPMLNTDSPAQVLPNSTFTLPADVPLLAGPGASPLLGLPVADIATVEVLKGAAATARYGAQGSHGVLLITTRRGGQASQPQPLRVGYEAFGGVQQVRQRYALLDGRQQATVANEIHQQFAGAPGAIPTYTPAQIDAIGRGSDWQQELFRNAVVQSHHLSAQGSSQRARYYASANYLRQTGVVVGSGLDRYGLRAGLEYQASARVLVFGRLALSQLDRDRPNSRLVSMTLLSSPLMPAREADGSYYTGNNPYSLRWNPLAAAELTSSTERNRRLLSQAGARIQLKPSLSLSAQAGHERSQVDGQDFSFNIGERLTPLPQRVATQVQTREATANTAELRLDYERPAPGRHALRASLTYLLQAWDLANVDSTYVYDNRVVVGRGFNRSLLNQKVNSLILDGHYAYNGRYEVLASVRTDARRSQPPQSENTTQWYAGAEGRWHLSQTKALAGRLKLTTLDLRAGLGQTSTWLANKLNAFNGYANKQSLYTPERSTHLDASLHLGWRQDQLRLTLGAYHRTTDDSYFSFIHKMPSAAGQYYDYMTGTASVVNRGLELTLAADWHLGTLRGQTSVAAARNQHVVNLADSDDAYYPYLKSGEPVTNFSLHTQTGIYPQGSRDSAGGDISGQPRYDDANGHYESQSGSGLPGTILNLSQQLGYQRWELTAQLDALLGYDINNPTLLGLDQANPYGANSTRVLDRWTPGNPGSMIPGALPIPTYLLPSDKTVENGDHLRLSQLILSYQVLKTASHQLTVWGGGQNIFVLTSYRGFDPNVSSGGSASILAGYDNGAYPTARTWLLGVRASF
jgi:TonB-dependent SusC/RagA subfamily outer membrane receptor